MNYKSILKQVFLGALASCLLTQNNSCALTAQQIMILGQNRMAESALKKKMMDAMEAYSTMQVKATPTLWEIRKNMSYDLDLLKKLAPLLPKAATNLRESFVNAQTALKSYYRQLMICSGKLKDDENDTKFRTELDGVFNGYDAFETTVNNYSVRLLEDKSYLETDYDFRKGTWRGMDNSVKNHIRWRLGTAAGELLEKMISFTDALNTAQQRALSYREKLVKTGVLRA